MNNKRIYIFLLLLLFTTGLFAQTNADEQMAAQYYSAGEYEKAIEIYQRLFESSQNKLYYSFLLKSYENVGDFKQAEKLVQRQIKKYPQELVYLVDLGNIYLKSEKKPTKGEKQFNEAIEKLGLNQMQMVDLANAFEQIGQIKYAIETYKKGRQLFKNQTLFTFELSSLYLREGMNDEIVAEYLAFLDAFPEAMPTIQIQLQNLMANSPNDALSNSLRSALVKRIQKTPENRIYTEMMIWYSIQQKDFEFAFTQAKAIDKRFPADEGTQVFRVAGMAMSNNIFDVASEAYHYLIAKGASGQYYMQSRIGYLDAKYNRIISQLIIQPKEIQDLRKDYEQTLKELGQTASTVILMKNLGHLLAFYGNDIQGAADILYEAIEIKTPNTELTADCKLELADILLFAGDVWEASILYSQVEKAFKNDAIGSMAKFKNAKLSYYIGEFEWAKTQLDVLRSSTSKLIANDAMELSLLISDNMEDDSTYSSLEYYAKADLMMYRNHLDEALLYLDSLRILPASHPISDEVIMKEAEIRLKQGLYHLADSLLQELVKLYPHDILADDALFMLGELYETQFKNSERAMEFYERILMDYSGSLYATEARKRFRNLRKS